MNANILIDTNLWVYLYAADNPKSPFVHQVVKEQFDRIIISTQILGELYHVLTRKAYCKPMQARVIVNEMCVTFPVLSITTNCVLNAMDIVMDYKYSYWDSLVLATAMLNECEIVYSEDMQHNQRIGELRIINPLV